MGSSTCSRQSRMWGETWFSPTARLLAADASSTCEPLVADCWNNTTTNSMKPCYNKHEYGKWQNNDNHAVIANCYKTFISLFHFRNTLYTRKFMKELPVLIMNFLVFPCQNRLRLVLYQGLSLKLWLIFVQTISLLFVIVSLIVCVVQMTSIKEGDVL